MSLAKELQEASASRVYFYIETKDGKSAGGPYPSIPKLAAGIKRAQDRGLSRNDLVAKKLVNGQPVTLSPDEMEAVIAAME